VIILPREGGLSVTLLHVANFIVDHRMPAWKHEEGFALEFV
jgi:hypothetical protein